MTLSDLGLLKRLQGQPAIEDRHRKDIVSDLVPAFDAMEDVPADCPFLVYAFYVEPAINDTVIRKLEWGGVDPRAEPWLETLSSFGRVLAASNPLATLVLVTDHSSSLPAFPGRHRIVRAEFSARRLMFERQRAFTALLRSRVYDRPVVFLDTDAIATRDLREVFEADFDVGLTYRAATSGIYALMPVNEGVIFANVRRPDRTIAFFEELLVHYQALAENRDILDWYPDGIWCWRGGQLALNSVSVGWKLFQEDSEVRTSMRGDARVTFFPCRTHNRSPGPADEDAALLIRESFVVHFKGDRKSTMFEFADLLEKKESAK